MNKLGITGNLTREPVTKTTPNGNTVCEFSVAVDKRGKDKGAEFFTVSAWGKQAESCARFLSKGRKVLVWGELSCGAYIKDGEARYQLKISADDVEFLGSKSDGEGYTSEQNPGANAGFEEVTDDSLPF